MSICDAGRNKMKAFVPAAIAAAPLMMIIINMIMIIMIIMINLCMMCEADLCWMLLPRLPIDLHWGRVQ